MKICLQELLHETRKLTLVFSWGYSKGFALFITKYICVIDWFPCILSESADPKFIWGYYLDRFFPNENIVLSQQLKARKHTVTLFFVWALGLVFFHPAFFGFMHGCLQISDLHHNGSVELNSSYFPLFFNYIIDTQSSILSR